MLKGFAIKKTVYQGRIAAKNSSGQVVNVHRRGERPIKPSKRNQQWMRG